MQSWLRHFPPALAGKDILRLRPTIKIIPVPVEVVAGAQIQVVGVAAEAAISEARIISTRWTTCAGGFLRG
ncbi:MAG: hypothetical protein ACXWIN_06890, partial [Burkholderiaceae bacterium]